MNTQEQQKPPWAIIARVTLIAIAVGLFAGVIGTVTTENYLSDYTATLNEHTDNELKLAQEKPRPLPGTYEEAAEQIRTTILPAVAVIYAPTISNVLQPGFEIGLGVLITSDGWVATSREALSGYATKPELLRVFVDKKEYKVLASIADPLSDLVMIHLDGTGLPVVPFGASNAVESGDLAFVVIGDNTLLPTAVTNANQWSRSETTLEAEQFVQQFAYADIFSVKGAPVVNSAGELIAIDKTPLHHILPVIRSIIRDQSIQRAYFGASIIDLHNLHVTEAISQGYTRGAYVSRVALDSPAAAAGIKPGDIILRFGDVTLSGSETLSEQIAAYHPDDFVTLTIIRSGEENEFTVQLGGYVN